jgi:uncharacterized protein (TIGR02996 family)
MMGRSEFLTAIRDFPHDIEPRLRFAGLLEDENDPRGEFIRTQCDLETLSVRNPIRIDLETRERELLADHEDEWLGPLAGIVDWAVFQRGFVEEIAISARAFLEHADRILAWGPIREVHFRGAERKMPDLAACPALARVTFVDLSDNYLRDIGVKTLATSPHLARLEGLNLGSTGIGDAAVRALARSTTFPSLRELYLCGNRVSRRGLKTLAGSRLIGRLERLSLRFNDCEPGELPEHAAILV